MKLFKVVLTFHLLCSAFLLNAAEYSSVTKGILDLRGVDLNQSEPIKFNGQWEFYWNQLLYASQLKNKISDSVSYINVPSVWTDYKVNDTNLPAFGAATYRMQILLDKDVDKLAFKLGSFATAFNLYVNNKWVAGAGKVSLSEKDAVAGFNPGVVVFDTPNDTVEVILHISNYHYAKGGFWESYGRLGSEASIRNSWNRDIQLSILLIGCILIFAFYHLGLYFMNRYFRYTLYFSLFCIIIVLRTLVINEIFLLDLFPGFNWVAVIKIEYLTLILGSLAFSLFIYKFYNKEFPKFAIQIFIVATIIFTLCVLLTQPAFFTRFLFVFQVNIILNSLVILYAVIKAIARKKPSVTLLLIGFFVLMLSLINDILHNNRVIETALVTSYGFLVFILSQSLMLSSRFSYLLVKSERLTKELEQNNTGLEKTIKERTSKIQEQNTLLNKQNKEIRSSIEYASKIQGAIVDTNCEIAKVAPDNFILFSPKDIVSGDFYWFKELQVKGVTYKVVAVVDCTGHGVPGAFMSILGALFLNKVISELPSKPSAAQVLNKMRDEVKTVLRQYSENAVKDGMDMALAIIDYSKMELQFAGANNPLYIIRALNNGQVNNIEEYKGDPMPIGIYVKEREVFTNHSIAINKNDLLYLFTDGYYDQFGGEFGTKFMKNTFKKLLIENAHLPLVKQKEILEIELKKWQGTYEQIDDITVIGIKV